MKRLILIVIVLLLIGGGVGAWLLTAGGDPEEGTVVEAPPPDPAFVELGYLVLPLIQEGRVTHHVELRIVLDVDKADEKDIEAAIPKIFDRFLTEVHGLLALRFVQQAPNPRELLRDRLRLLSKRLLGTAVVNDVLIPEFKRFRPRGN